MIAQRGDMVRLAIGDGGNPENFTLLGGARLTALEIQNAALENTSVQSADWRSFLSGSGMRQMLIQCEGLFADSAAEASVRAAVFTGVSQNYQVTFGNGDAVSGPFIIRQYEKYGEYGREELYRLSLQSSGMITYMAG